MEKQNKKTVKAEKVKMLSAEELYAFSDEMGMMIKSGVSALEGISLMLEESHSEKEKVLLEQMQSVIYDKNSFAAAVKATKVFPAYYEHMIEVGEQTGKTDEVLCALSHHYERENAICRAIRSAVSYPLFLTIMMFVIIAILVTRIMPIFERVYIQLGTSMEGLSSGILKIGEFISKYSIVFALILALLVGTGFWLAKTVAGRRVLIAVVCKLPMFGRIYDKIMLSRFASGMAMTISSGMDMTQALEMAGGFVTSSKLQKDLELCREKFEESTDIGTAFSACGIFKGLYGRMVILAAKTGNMEQIMEKVADHYQDETDDEIHNLISVVEPTLVIILSIVVGLILMSVMLPLLNIMASMY